MINEPFADFLEHIITKFNTVGTFATNPENVVIGESLDLMRRPDTSFTRIEILVGKLKFDGFDDQRNLSQSFRVGIAGHIRRAVNAVQAVDMFEAIRFAREITKILYSTHTDRLNGIKVCAGFLQMGGYSEADLEYEMFPRVTSVLYVAEAKIQLEDTYSNN